MEYEVFRFLFNLAIPKGGEISFEVKARRLKRRPWWVISRHDLRRMAEGWLVVHDKKGPRRKALLNRKAT
jgi:hypothetical protein